MTIPGTHDHRFSQVSQDISGPEGAKQTACSTPSIASQHCSETSQHCSEASTSWPEIAEFLAQFEAQLVLELDHVAGPQALREAARHLTLSGDAKRIRPRLVYCFARAVGVTVPEAQPIALAAEFIHSASLLHDDVIDEGTVRRGQPTANMVWSNIVSVLSGDILLCRGLQLLEPLPRRITSDAIHLVAQMTRGIAREVEWRYQAAMTSEDWRAVAEDKTGSLFEWCGKAAATLHDEQCDEVDDFGRVGVHLGIGFQIADDLYDLLLPDPNKDRWADLKSGTLSLPLLIALEQDPQQRDILEALWSKAPPGDLEEREHAVAELIDDRVVVLSRQAAMDEIDRATHILEQYDARPGIPQLFDWIAMLRTAFEL